VHNHCNADTGPGGKGKIQVLVFPCGAENAIEIHRALRYSIHVDLHGASSVDDHGTYRFDSYCGDLPNIQHPEFETAFAALISRLNIDVVFATHDSVMEYLATRSERLGVALINGDPDTASTARRKSRTYRTFSDCAWSPRIFDDIAHVTSWPVVIKPDAGQGGQGVVVAPDADHARLALASTADPIIMEYLPGEEVSVDCFTDRHRKVIWTCARTRERVRAGIAMRSRILKPDSDIEAIARHINSRLRLRGPWFFQLKRDLRGDWKLLEISCRIAGTMVAQRAHGINLPLMAIQDYLERDLVCLPNRQVDMVDRCISTRARMSSPFDTVFVDLDDTLIINGYPTPLVMAFLYQCLSEGKTIKLITRHAYDVSDTLRAARISESLFSEIIHIRDGDVKSRYLTPGSLFIDNHFPERLDASRNSLATPVDVDSLEFFIK